MQFRQGLGKSIHFYGKAPTARTDGTPITEGEISKYVRFAIHEGSPVETMDVQLVSGEFSEVLDVDAVGVGIYTYWYHTVDSEGRESGDSDKVSFEVAGPLAQPNPPSGIYIT